MFLFRSASLPGKDRFDSGKFQVNTSASFMADLPSRIFLRIYRDNRRFRIADSRVKWLDAVASRQYLRIQSDFKRFDVKNDYGSFAHHYRP